MTTGTEHLRTGEILSPAELGEKTHAFITDIVTKLQGVPEFGNALRRDFFGRNIPGIGRDLSHVYFERKGEFYGWVISYHAEPKRFRAREYDPSIILSINKFKADPNLPRDQAAGDQVESVYLTTAFTENTDGKILRFTGGSARVSDEKGHEYEREMALEKIPGILADLFAPIKI